MPAEENTYVRQDALADVTALQTFGLTAFTSAASAWVEAAGRIGGETASFMAERAREDLKTQMRMMQCTDVAEFQRIQTEHIQTAMRQYTEAAAHLAGLSLPLFGIGKSTQHTPV